MSPKAKGGAASRHRPVEYVRPDRASRDYSAVLAVFATALAVFAIAFAAFAMSLEALPRALAAFSTAGTSLATLLVSAAGFSPHAARLISATAAPATANFFILFGSHSKCVPSEGTSGPINVLRTEINSYFQPNQLAISEFFPDFRRFPALARACPDHRL